MSRNIFWNDCSMRWTRPAHSSSTQPASPNGSACLELAESFDRLNLTDKSSFNPSDFFYANSEMQPQADVKNGDYEVNSSFGPIPCYVSRPCNSKSFLVFHQRRRLVAEFMHSIFYDSLFSTHRSLLRFNLISATPF